MTKTRYIILEGDCSPYFVTAAVVNWIPAFSNPEIAKIIIETIAFLQSQKRLIIYAYVLMENHIHLVVSSEDLRGAMSSFRSYSARKCIDFYIRNKNQYMLKQLAHYRPNYRSDRKYRFWQEGLHPKQIRGEEMMRQKIEYIHQNPVRRGYVDAPEHWRYSSARNYSGIAAMLDICTDW